MTLTSDRIMTAAAIAAGVAVIYIVMRGWRGAAADVTSAAVNVAAGAAEGAVVGVGSIFGIPATDEARCTQAIEQGNTWEASKYCTAGTFIGSVWDDWTAGRTPPLQ